MSVSSINNKINVSNYFNAIKRPKNITFRASYKPIDNKQDDAFKKESSYSKSLSDNNEVIKYLREDEFKYSYYEYEMGGYLSSLNNKKWQSVLSRLKNLNISQLNSKCHVDDHINTKFIEKFLENAGIKNVFHLSNFVKTNLNNNDFKQTFNMRYIEAIQIYGLLKNKSYLYKYPEILSHLFEIELSKENPNYDILDEYCNTLNKYGINNLSELDKKFEQLKPEFNDFKNTSDKIEVIDYLQQTYSDRLNYTQVLIGENSKKSINDLYKENSDIINYLYEHKGEYYEFNIKSVMKIALEAKNMKASGINKIAPNFNNFKEIQDKLAFYNFLHENNVTPKEFNTLATNSIISDSDLNKNIKNKEPIVRNLKFFFKGNEKQASDYYMSFKDAINGIFDINNIENTGTENIENLIKLTTRFNIKNQNDLLKLYNNAYKTNKKNISSKELKEFIDLLNYDDSKTIFEDAKALNMTVCELLTKEKNEFESVKPEIENFIVNDSTNFYTDKTPLEIYKNFKTLIKDNNDNINSILSDIAKFTINDSEEYKTKVNKLKTLSNYIDNPNLLKNFITRSNIKFDNTTEENQHFENCVEVLSGIYDEKAPEQTNLKLKKLTKSKFLSNSKATLTEFLNSFENDNDKKNTLNVIADKKIHSLDAWVNFIREYKGEGKYYDKNLVNHLLCSPDDIDFNAYKFYVNHFKDKLEEYHLPFSITSKNINNLDINSVRNLEDTDYKSFFDILNKLINVQPDNNFLSKLKYSYMRSSRKSSKPRIAQEIIHMSEKPNGKYKNLEKALKIDKESLNINDNTPYYIYLEKIKKALPDEFINFINSDKWKDIKNDGKIPNISPHALLRFIDRIGLEYVKGDINKLYEPETENKLLHIFKTIYTKNPVFIRTDRNNSIIVIRHKYNDGTIESIFDNKGIMCSIVNQNAI